MKRAHRTGRAPLSFNDYSNGGSGQAAGAVSARAGAPGALATPVTSGQAQGAIAPAQGQPPALVAQATPPQGRLLRLAPQDAARLPRGAHFVGVDGVTRVVR
jgi:hypothetical protein